jgi:flagellar basal body-associated protein FliL
MTFSVKAKAKAPVENSIGAGRVLLIMAGAIAAVAGMAALAWFFGVEPARMFVLL